MNNFVGEFTLDIKLYPRIVSAQARSDIGPMSMELEEILDEVETKDIVNNLEELQWVPVGVNGMKGSYQEGDKIGSLRASAYSPDVARELFERIKPHLPETVNFGGVPTDTEGHSLWKPVGVNPLLRFIRYPDQGTLVVHYDAPYIESGDRRTLLTLVIYLKRDPETEGGRTRFIVDPQYDLPLEERDLSDWSRNARQDEVRLAVEPPMGGAIIFPHRLLHDSEDVTGGEKWILRTDIEFERV